MYNISNTKQWPARDEDKNISRRNEVVMVGGRYDGADDAQRGSIALSLNYKSSINSNVCDLQCNRTAAHAEIAQWFLYCSGSL